MYFIASIIPYIKFTQTIYNSHINTRLLTKHTILPVIIMQNIIVPHSTKKLPGETLIELTGEILTQHHALNLLFEECGEQSHGVELIADRSCLAG